MAKSEQVEVVSNGNPVAVVVSPEHFQAASSQTRLGRPRRLGWFQETTRGFDSEAFLNTDISEVFSE